MLFDQIHEQLGVGLLREDGTGQGLAAAALAAVHVRVLLDELAGRGRSWLLSGGRNDSERGAAVILDEFRAGKAGKITLERVEE